MTGSGARTREKILDEAERRFARRGIDGVSVRSIMDGAGLNLGLLHYHFRTRENLLLEVLRRRMEPLNQRRLELLTRAEETAGPRGPTLEAVLRSFCSPLVDLLMDNPEFARLAGHLHVTSEASVRRAFAELFVPVLRRFAGALRKASRVPLSEVQWLCRAHFTLGVVIHPLTHFGDLKAMARGRRLPTRSEFLDEMVAFCAAGLGVPPNQGGPRRGRRRR